MYAHYTSDKIVTKTVYFDVTVFFVFKARLQRHNSTRRRVELSCVAINGPLGVFVHSVTMKVSTAEI